MEYLFSSGVGVLTAGGIYLLLRFRTFPVILGLALITYAVNLFLFSAGRLAENLPPVLDSGLDGFSDPLPQALVLTAIVISFGMTAVVVMMALGAWLVSDSDKINMEGEQAPDAGDEEGRA